MGDGTSSVGVEVEARGFTKRVADSLNTARNFGRKAKDALGVTATGLQLIGDLAELSLSRPTVDKKINIDGNQIRFSAQEFTPKTGQIKDPEEAVIFLIGAPLQVSASIGWEGPESLAEQCKVKTYSVGARPIGEYSGDAIDLEVKAILEFLDTLTTGDPEHPKFKKFTLVAHSVGVPKAFKLAAEIYEKRKNMQVMGIAAMNPSGLYPQSAKDIFSNYAADGLNQPKLANPRAKHQSPLEVFPQIIGSIRRDMYDAGRGYPKLLADQVKSAAGVSPDLVRVHAPVVLFLGAEDKVMQKDLILPPAEIAKYLPLTNPQGELMRKILTSREWAERMELTAKKQWTRKKDQQWDDGLTDAEKNLFGSKEVFVRVQREQMAQLGYANDAYAKDHYLPNAAQVRVIVAKKFASHLAFNERRDTTSHVTSDIFEWMRKNPAENRNRKRTLRDKLSRFNPLRLFRKAA